MSLLQTRSGRLVLGGQKVKLLLQLQIISLTSAILLDLEIQSINQSINQSIHRSIHQSINRSINRSIDQLIYQLINIPVYLSFYLHRVSKRAAQTVSVSNS